MARDAVEHAATLAADVVSGTGPSARGGDDALAPLLAGRYRIVERLGAGAMGTVYRAHDVELDEDVALKTLRRELVDAPGALERFRREVKLARRVTHRGVARTFDLGEHEGEKFLTMELVDGPSLARVLRERGPLPPAEAAGIALQIAEALAVAHAAGVVHRDLKPDNVLLARDGRVVLTDFGVARAVAESDARATQAGGIVGTPAYMAPEQVEGGDVGGGADLYALGIVLFEMLSGTLPFAGESALAMAAARLVRPPTELAAVAPGVPAELVELVRALLARAPSARPAGAAAVQPVLARCAAGEAATEPATKPASIAPPRPHERAEETRLAVMPITPATPEVAWVAEGLTADLIDGLSMARGVRVRARPDAQRDGEPLDALGRRLDVEVVVDGRVRADGDRVRVTLRLVSVRDGFQVWAHRFDAAVGELLRVSDEATHAMADALAGASLHAAPRAAISGEVAELYLRARADSGRMYQAPAERAVASLERALALAPDDTTLLAAHAIQLAQMSAFGLGDVQRLARARADAERALALAPHLPEPHLALAQLERWHGDVPSAVRSLFRARSRGPSVAPVEDALGRITADVDLIEDAMGHFRRALWLDPDLHHGRVDLARMHAFRGEWEEVELVQQELATRSGDHYALSQNRFASWRNQPMTRIDRPGQPPEMGEIHALFVQITDRGDGAEQAVSALAARVATIPAARLRRLYHQISAEVLAPAGFVDAAVAAVRRASEDGLADLTWVRHCPALAALRGRPELAEIERTVLARVQPTIDAYRECVALGSQS